MRVTFAVAAQLRLLTRRQVLCDLMPVLVHDMFVVRQFTGIIPPASRLKPDKALEQLVNKTETANLFCLCCLVSPQTWFVEGGSIALNISCLKATLQYVFI